MGCSQDRGIEHQKVKGGCCSKFIPLIKAGCLRQSPWYLRTAKICKYFFNLSSSLSPKSFMTLDLDPSYKQTLKWKPEKRYSVVILHHPVSMETNIHLVSSFLEFLNHNDLQPFLWVFPRMSSLTTALLWNLVFQDYFFFSVTSSSIDSFYIPFYTSTLWPHWCNETIDAMIFLFSVFLSVSSWFWLLS